MLCVEVDGGAPTTEQLHRVAVVNYGHFTSMQVRENRVRGWDLHLRRLDEASREMFGASPGADRFGALLRHALAGAGALSGASARIAVFARSGDVSDPANAPDLGVMVSLTDPVAETRRPAWRVRAMPYQRDAPHLKHTATMGLSRNRRAARAEGFDDVLFTGPDQLVLEGSIWNLGLWDGGTVTWPEGPKLPGITEQLLTAGLHRIGAHTRTRPVRWDELAGFQAAFAAYSWCPSQPLAAVDGLAFANPPAAYALLDEAWAAVPWQPV